MHESYENQLRRLRFIPAVKQLFVLIQADGNIIFDQEYILERKQLLRQVYEQETLFSSARKLFIRNELEMDDFRILKNDYNAAISQLKLEIDIVNGKLNKSNGFETGANFSDDLHYWYNNLDVEDKRMIISMVLPDEINPDTANFNSIKLNAAISKIVTCEA